MAPTSAIPKIRWQTGQASQPAPDTQISRKKMAKISQFQSITELPNSAQLKAFGKRTFRIFLDGPLTSVLRESFSVADGANPKTWNLFL